MQLVRIANFLFSLFFLNSAVKNSYPLAYNNTMINISYFCIYYFSKIQMVFIKIINNLTINYNDLLIKYPILPNNINKINHFFIKNEELEYINNGEIIYTKSIKDLLQNYKKKDKNIENNFNIIIYTDNKNKNKKIFNDIPFCYNCEETNYKFILVEIMINNEIIKVDFKTNEYNYMIVDNVINKNFIIYFLKKHYKKFVNTVLYYGGNLEKYSLKILDQNVNQVVLDKNNCLTIKNNNYELFLENIN